MILVTGAGGVLGKAVLSRARELGLDVQGIVRQPEVDGAHDTIACDLASCPSLTDLVVARPSTVIHLAAAVPHSPRYPDSEASAGLTRKIDACVLAAVADWGSHVLYASSCGLYDRQSPVLKLEASGPIRVDSPYFAAKLEGEQRFLGRPGCTVLRLPAPIGPGIPEGLVARRFVSQAMAGAALEVWGSGRREQNFVDCDDIAQALLAAARVGYQGIINIASERPVTMLELAQRVVAAIGKGRVELSGRPDPRDLETARYSTQRAAAILGWSPRASLEHSIRSLAEHILLTRGSATAQR